MSPRRGACQQQCAHVRGGDEQHCDNTSHEHVERLCEPSASRVGNASRSWPHVERCCQETTSADVGPISVRGSFVGCDASVNYGCLGATSRSIDNGFETRDHRDVPPCES